MDFDFTGSEVAELGTFDIYFEMGGAGGGTKTVYKLEGATVNSATIDFEIDGIATINWSGMCKVISEVEKQQFLVQLETIMKYQQQITLLEID